MFIRAPKGMEEREESRQVWQEAQHSPQGIKGIKNTKRYKAEVEKIIANATKEKAEVDEKTSTIASLLRSEVEKQVKFATRTKPGNSTVASSEIEFESALRSIFKSKDKSK